MTVHDKYPLSTMRELPKPTEEWLSREMRDAEPSLTVYKLLMKLLPLGREVRARNARNIRNVRNVRDSGSRLPDEVLMSDHRMHAPPGKRTLHAPPPREHCMHRHRVTTACTTTA